MKQKISNEEYNEYVEQITPTYSEIGRAHV